MQFDKVRLYLSSPRIDRYLLATGNNNTKAVALYKANLKVAQAFHPVLGILEVAMRNRINTILTIFFSDPDWIINEKNGFMTHPSLTYIDRRTGRLLINVFLKSSVEKAEQRFRRLRVPITSGRIIAEQTLGFWTDLFEVHHYKILRGRPIKIFDYLPSGYGRREVWDLLTKIRKFRNRINHNEPVCFRGAAVDFAYVEEVYDAIITITCWLDPELVGWMKDIDLITTKIANAKSI